MWYSSSHLAVKLYCCGEKNDKQENYSVIIFFIYVLWFGRSVQALNFSHFGCNESGSELSNWTGQVEKYTEPAVSVHCFTHVDMYFDIISFATLILEDIQCSGAPNSEIGFNKLCRYQCPPSNTRLPK